MNAETIFEESQKLPPDQRQALRDFVLADEKEQISEILKKRAQGPFVPFDPSDETFFDEVREESERILEAEND